MYVKVASSPGSPILSTSACNLENLRDRALGRGYVKAYGMDKIIWRKYVYMFIVDDHCLWQRLTMFVYYAQMADFFELGEEEVEGYEAPSLITELHVHLNSCSIEYK